MSMGSLGLEAAAAAAAAAAAGGGGGGGGLLRSGLDPWEDLATLQRASGVSEVDVEKLQDEASEEEAELDDETWAKNVTAGKLSKGAMIEVVRGSGKEKTVVFTGKLASLRRIKDTVNEVRF